MYKIDKKICDNWCRRLYCRQASKAIKDTGNILLASLDPTDSVGIIDSYFPDSHFFVEFERFDRHVDKLRRSGVQVDLCKYLLPQLPA